MSLSRVRLPVLAEYLLPFVRRGGRAIALKGMRYREEVEDARCAVQLLGGNGIKAIPVALPGLDDQRAIVVMEKVRAIPKAYPRKAGTPAKEPLL